MERTGIASSGTPTASRQGNERQQLGSRLRAVRSATERLAAPLTAEDQSLQSMPSCSPVKWHRAHTTWFWEAFVLGPRGVAPFDPRYGVLFNSYYEALGTRHARPKRGLLSRPTADEVGVYRRAVDALVQECIAESDHLPALRALVELGMAHEEQHQELILTDVLHAFAQNPLRPAYQPARPSAPGSPTPLAYVPFDGGLVEIGAEPGPDFRFDNEEPRHRVYLRPFQLADRLLTVAEWKLFARAGGYRNAALWLSDGWDWVNREGIEAPAYGRLEGDDLIVFGLEGERIAHDDEPITHVSFYEADALARFFDARLPTEAEWEFAARGEPVTGNFLESGALRALPSIRERSAAVRRSAEPTPGPSIRERSAAVRRSAEPTPAARPLAQLYGDAWEWTQSPYVPYPGYQPAAGALGEYNGKFMANQIVLRGGSCLTPGAHMRATYRNFWPADTQFQVAGVRLALEGRSS